jgi:hypothetical protein
LPDHVGDAVEVAIVVQEGKAMLDRDLRNQAVIAAARRLSGLPAILIKPGRRNKRILCK